MELCHLILSRSFAVRDNRHFRLGIEKPTEVFFMSNNENQKQTIYYRPLKRWIEVTAEGKKKWERFVGTQRKKQQRASCCCVPYKKSYRCDGLCDTCEYRCIPKDQPQVLSIDAEWEAVLEGTSSYSSFLSDDALITQIDLDRLLIKQLMLELKQTDHESYQILLLVASGLSERECAKKLGMARSTYTSKRDRILKELRKKI